MEDLFWCLGGIVGLCTAMALYVAVSSRWGRRETPQFVDLLEEHTGMEIERACERAAQRDYARKREREIVYQKRPGCTAVGPVAEYESSSPPENYWRGRYRPTEPEPPGFVKSGEQEYAGDNLVTSKLVYDGGMERDEDEIDRIRRKNRGE